MFLTAARTLANYVSETDLSIGRIYPSLAEVKEVSVAIAIEVAKMAYDEGLASVYPEPKDLAKHVQNQMYSYYYETSMPVVWDWKPEETFNVRPIQPVPKNI
ncbi:NAD-dependent malic enzyme, mitochondrial-like [Ostrinia furnacalis]|nr:NAD-dependent malic enzyme, mitochondrial-like [Ostrinia furnacalis]